MYWATAILGVLLAAAPFVLQYTDNPAALWTSLLIGAGVVLVSAFEAVEKDKDPIEYWLAGILGLAAIGAPFVLSYTEATTAMWATIIAGTLIGIASLGRILIKADMTYS